MHVAGLLPTDVSEFCPEICGPASLPLIEDDELVTLLQQAAESELDGLVRCLLQKGRLTCQLGELPAFKESHPFHRVYARDIAAEIQKYGANTMVSQLFRAGKGVRYGEIVRDVADRLGIKPSKSVLKVESDIRLKILELMWEEMTPEERTVFLKEFDVWDPTLAAKAALPFILIEATKLTGFGAYKASVIVANAAAKVFLGHGLGFAMNAMLPKGLCLLLGKTGYILAGLYAVSVLGGEAYRVTVPCVLQVAMIRQAVLIRNGDNPLPK